MASCTTPPLRSYVEGLSGEGRERYNAKVKMCGLDPFKLSPDQLVKNFDLWPHVDTVDISDYLVRKVSYISRKQMKAVKSLEAHNYVTSGWVKEPHVTAVRDDQVILISEVNHSQALSAQCARAWILAKNDGEITTAHCTCMAGIGEACSHVAAILFYVEAGRRMKSQVSCTDTENQWLPPHVKKVASIPVSEMDFASAEMKKKRLYNAGTLLPKKDVRVKAPPPSKEEWDSFFDTLVKSGVRPAVAATDPRYSDLYVPKVSRGSASFLQKLYDPSALNLSWEQVMVKCNALTKHLTIGRADTVAIEEATKEQSHCRLWFKYRAGRITASNLRQACHTRVEKPSISLLKRICYPEDHTFSSVQTTYGLKQEKHAITAYMTLARERHDEAYFTKPGLTISESRSFLAATPDLLVGCTCCGKGVVEVKCPYKFREEPLELAANDITSCVTLVDKELCLKKDHAYFYQIQLQMLACDVNYGDFVLWNANQINVQRIARDNEFLCVAVSQAEQLFTLAIMPELVARWFSRKATTLGHKGSQEENAATGSAPSTSTVGPKYCICKGPEEGKMIACDSENCSIVWYHFACVGLKRAPKSRSWFCKQCA